MRRELGAPPRQTTRREEIARRPGGEEFVPILPEITRGEALEAADRVRTGVGRGGDPPPGFPAALSGYWM